MKRFFRGIWRFATAACLYCGKRYVFYLECRSYSEGGCPKKKEDKLKEMGL